MSLPLDVSSVFGLCGQKTVETMVKAIEESFKNECQLTYNEQTKTFTILNSREISRKTIQEIFSRESYDGWQPQVQFFPDREGNKIVKLIGVQEEIQKEVYKVPGPSSDFDRIVEWFERDKRRVVALKNKL